MDRRWPWVATGVVVLGIAAAGVFAVVGDSAGDGQDAATPSRPAAAPRMSAAPARPTDPPVAVAVTDAVRTAPAVATVATGPGLRVERVRLPQPTALTDGAAPVTEVLRLTVEARMHVRNAPLGVWIDGAYAGRAIEAPDLNSAVAVLPDAGIRDGAVVGYGYGQDVTRAGELRVTR